MAKYLVEVSHSPDKIECLHTIQIFLSSGSHFLTHADWGCLDGDHKALSGRTCRAHSPPFKGI